MTDRDGGARPWHAPGWRPATLSAHGGGTQPHNDGDVVPPIRPSTTFTRDPDYGLTGPNEYQRDDSPTLAPAENLLARLEEGQEALLFGSGMAAAAAVVQALKPGDHIVAQRVMYWGLRAWLEDFCARWGIGLDLVEASPAAIRAACRRGETKLVWIETPSNPTWDVIDIAASAQAAHDAGATLVADSTVATPVHTRPLTLRADIVMHSATKALNGHSDVLAGALVVRDPENGLWPQVRRNRKQGGAMLGAFEGWLLLRGMRTLYVRQQQASANAQQVAAYLARHPKVESVRYPGLPDHPGHEIAARQMTDGFGSMLSFNVRGGHDAARRVAGACQLFIRATSLGGVESLIEHRQSIEGADSPAPANLLRVSIGIESAADLIADLDAALAQI